MKTIITLSLISLALTSIAWNAPNATAPSVDEVRQLWSPFFKPISKVAPNNKADTKVIDLGRRLFFERALSADKSVSCNDCHDLSNYGANGAAAVKAREAGTLRRDVPSVYNLADFNMLGWAASQTSLRDQTAAALTSPVECNMTNGDSVVPRLADMPIYQKHFKTAFGEGGVTFDRVVDALTAFQNGLVTPSPFDDFLLGNDKALTVDQLKGAVLFDEKNCSSCHTGSSVGGQMIQKAGIIKPWPNQKDLGHFDITGKAAHKMAFRVPPLRNVAVTAPYFHDHSVRSLRRAIWTISILEQGVKLDFDDIRLIESFLESLTGELPTTYIKPPAIGSQH